MRLEKVKNPWAWASALCWGVTACLMFLNLPTQGAAPKPASLGKIKSAKPLAKTSAKEKGSALCLSCHDWENEGMDHSLHGRVLAFREKKGKTKGMDYCAACHAGDPHVDHAPVTDAACLNCHNNPQEAGVRALREEALWRLSAHPSAGLGCQTCHDVHEREALVSAHPKGRQNLRKSQPTLCIGCHPQRRGQLGAFSHHTVKEGGLDCTSCHNPHGSPAGADYLLHDTQPALCTNCHQEKEGPFLFEHAATQGMFGEGCTHCHDPHGAGRSALLKTQGRALCAECHTDRGDHFSGLTCYASGCHDSLHGSNNPAPGVPLGR